MSQLRLSRISRPRRGVAEVGGLRFALADGDGHRLRPELLVPRLDLVSAGGEPLDLELSVLARRREEGMIHDADAGVHPAVDVALERYHLLRLVELALRHHAGRRLADIEAAIGLRNRLDVVQNGIAVLDVDVLTGHDAKDAWLVEAALLVDHGRFRRRGVLRARRKPALHVDEDVADLPVLHDDLRIGDRTGVLLLTLGFG